MLKKTKNQISEVLFMLINGEITRANVFATTGILNLTARIADLRRLGVDVVCSKIETTNKFNRAIKYGKWSVKNIDFSKELYDKINRN